MMSLRKKWLKNRFEREEKKAAWTFPIQQASVCISDYLNPCRILFFQERTSGGLILEELVRSLPVKETEAVSAAIKKREEAGSTVIAPGIAFPHARIPDLKEAASASSLFLRENFMEMLTGLKTSEAVLKAVRKMELSHA